MKIDSHQHFWKYNPVEYAWIGNEMKILKRDYLPEHLRPQVMQSGFDGTIAVQARQSLAETRWLLNLAADNEFIKGVVGWVDLCSGGLENQLSEFLCHPKFVGVRHVIQDEPDDFFILNDNFLKGIRSLKKFNLAYDILIFARHLPQTLDFVKLFPDQLFVLDHIAKPEIRNKKLSPWKEDIIKLAKYENVYCKLSGIVTEGDWLNWKADDFKPFIDTVVDAFGTKRILIGSDWPVCQLAGNYAEVMEIPVKYFSGLSLQEKEAVFGLNAEKAYHLKL
jgi:L-fuconolactonase